MTAGDIIRTHAFDVKKVTVKANEDTVAGEVINNLSTTADEFEQADAGGKGPFLVALEAHDYDVVETAGGEHTIKAMASGIVEVKKVAGVIPKGRFVEVSTTPGSVTIWDYTTPGDEFDIVGIADEDAATGDTTVKVRLRC